MADENRINPSTGNLDKIGMSTADEAAYLKLDASNDPVTGLLSLSAGLDVNSGLLEVGSGAAYSSVQISKNGPAILVISQANAATNAKNWYFDAEGGALYWGLVNDAFSFGDNYARITRTGASATEFDIMYGHTAQVAIADSFGMTAPNVVHTDVLGTAYPSAYDTIQGKGYGSGGYGTSNVFAVRQKGYPYYLCTGMDLAPWYNYPYGIFNAYGDSADTGVGYLRYLEFNINDRSQVGDKRIANLLAQASDSTPTYVEWAFRETGAQGTTNDLAVGNNAVSVGFSTLMDGITKKAKLHVRGYINDTGASTTVSDPSGSDIYIFEDSTYSSYYSSGDVIEYYCYFYKTAPDTTVVYSANPLYTTIAYSNTYSIQINVYNLQDGEGVRVFRSVNSSGFTTGIDLTSTGRWWDDNGYNGSPNSITWSDVTGYYPPSVTSPYTPGGAGTNTCLRTEDGDVKFLDGSGNLDFYYDATTRNFGVGATTLAAKLHVRANDSTPALLGLFEGDATKTTIMQCVARGYTDTNKQFWFGFDTTDNHGVVAAIIQNTGWKPVLISPYSDTGIGITADPTEKLEIGGNTFLNTDSYKLIFGTGKDMTIWYDGTYGQIKTSDVAASDLKITCGSQKTLELQNSVYDDIRVNSGNISRPGGNDPTWVSVAPGGSGTTTYLLEFDKDDYGTFTVQIPHGYKTGEDIKVHLHWTPGSRGNEENGNTVGWKVDYTWANVNSNFGTMSTADLSDACDGTDWKHQMTPEVTIDGHTVAKGISSMLICNVKRTDTGADDTWSTNTSGNLPLLLEVDFHFPIDTIGSRDWASK